MAAATYNQRARQRKTTAALIEPLIVTRDDVQSTDEPDAFCRIVAARTVRTANPSDRHVHLKRKRYSGCR